MPCSFPEPALSQHVFFSSRTWRRLTMSITDMRGADLRGYRTADREEVGTNKSKLLAATAVILGLVAVGAYAYTSHSLLPSAPVKQQAAAVSQPVAMTPPSQPSTSQPELAMPAPQAVPAPDVKASAPQTFAPQTLVKVHPTLKSEPAKRKPHVKARVPSTDESSSSPSVTSTDTAQSPSAAAPSVDTTTLYTAAPTTTQQNTITPQSVTPDTTTNTAPAQPQVQPPAPGQTAPQTQPQQ